MMGVYSQNGRASHQELLQFTVYIFRNGNLVLKAWRYLTLKIIPPILPQKATWIQKMDLVLWFWKNSCSISLNHPSHQNVWALKQPWWLLVSPILGHSQSYNYKISSENFEHVPIIYPFYPLFFPAVYPMIRARTLGRRRNARRPSRSSSGDGGCLGGKGSRNGLELSSFFLIIMTFIYIYNVGSWLVCAPPLP